MPVRILWFSICFLVVLASPALAHDCWLQPQTFSLVQGAALAFSLYVGDRFVPEKELALDPAVTRSFALAQKGGDTNLLQAVQPGSQPVLEGLELREEGEALISMERDFTHIELDPELFGRYLDHEHLDDIITMRKTLPSREKERERYARCIKTLVVAGEPSDSGLHSRELGQELEILLGSNPYTLEGSGRLGTRVLFRGEALGGKKVTAYGQSADGEVAAAVSVTDDQGWAEFEITGPGVWMVRLVHLIPCPEREAADWESYWGAYTFEVPA